MSSLMPETKGAWRGSQPSIFCFFYPIVERAGRIVRAGRQRKTEDLTGYGGTKINREHVALFFVCLASLASPAPPHRASRSPRSPFPSRALKNREAVNSLGRRITQLWSFFAGPSTRTKLFSNRPQKRLHGLLKA